VICLYTTEKKNKKERCFNRPSETKPGYAKDDMPSSKVKRLFRPFIDPFLSPADPLGLLGLPVNIFVTEGLARKNFTAFGASPYPIHRIVTQIFYGKQGSAVFTETQAVNQEAGLGNQ